MPDMIPVATQIQPPDPSKGLSTLSSIIGIRQQQQALQTGAYEQQKAQAGAIAAQQGAKELQAGAKLLSDPIGNGLIDEEGNPTKDSYSIIKSVMPTTGDDRYQSLLKTAQGHVEFRNSVQNLSQNEQGYVSSRLAGIAADPNAHISDVVNGINDLKSQFKGTAEEASINRLVKVMKDAIDDAGDKHGMDGVRQVVNGFSRGAVGNAGITGPGGVATPTATTMQAPGGLQPIQSNPMAPGGIRPIGQPLPQGIAPGTVVSPMTGGVGVINPAGQVRPVTEVPTAGASKAPFNPSYPGQQHDIETYRNEVQSVRQEAQQAPLARNINAQILRLSQDARTGPGSDVWQHVIGAVGAPFGLSPSASYQEVGKFLEKNAIAAMQSMGGPPSDSRLEAAAKANGGTSFSPEALQTVTKFNDATNTALDQYRQGIDHAVGMGQNVDYSRLPAFKAAWAKNFDVDVFRVENAIRDGDTAELARIKKELGPARLKALAEKRKNLTTLSQSGELP